MEVGTSGAENTLSALLDRVEQGVEVTITRRGKPVPSLTLVLDCSATLAWLFEDEQTSVLP